MSLFVTTFCINVTHKVLTHTSELPMVKEQGLVNLIPFPASCLYEYCGQQARPRLALALLNMFLPFVPISKFSGLASMQVKYIASISECILSFKSDFFSSL